MGGISCGATNVLCYERDSCSHLGTTVDMRLVWKRAMIRQKYRGIAFQPIWLYRYHTKTSIEIGLAEINRPISQLASPAHTLIHLPTSGSFGIPAVCQCLSILTCLGERTPAP